MRLLLGARRAQMASLGLPTPGRGAATLPSSCQAPQPNASRERRSGRGAVKRAALFGRLSGISSIATAIAGPAAQPWCKGRYRPEGALRNTLMKPDEA